MCELLDECSCCNERAHTARHTTRATEPVSFIRETHGQTKKKKKVCAVSRVFCTRTGTRARRGRDENAHAHCTRPRAAGGGSPGAPEGRRRILRRRARVVPRRCPGARQPHNRDPATRPHRVRLLRRLRRSAGDRARRTPRTQPHTYAYANQHTCTERNAHARATERWRSQHVTRSTHALARSGRTGRKIYAVAAAYTRAPVALPVDHSRGKRLTFFYGW